MPHVWDSICVNFQLHRTLAPISAFAPPVCSFWNNGVRRWCMRILLIESRMGRRKFFGFQQDPLGSQPPHQSSFLIPATREGGCDATKYILLSYAMVNVIPFSYLLWEKMWGSPCGVQRGPLSVVRRYFCFKLPYPALSRKSPQLALPSVSLKSTLVDQLKGGR